MPTGRIRELDGVRGFAILLIVIGHYVLIPIVTSGRSSLISGQQGLLLTWSGVDLFFVLSGFLIGGLLIDNRDATNYFTVFYVRRICRTFPLYVLLLATFLALSHIDWPFSYKPWALRLFDFDMPFASYLTMTQNIFMAIAGRPGAPSLTITWSLAVDEQFYLVFPIVVFVTPPPMLPLVLFCGALGAPMLRSVLPGSHGFFQMPCRLDPLFFGALLAYAVRNPSWIAYLKCQKTSAYILLAVLAVGSMYTGPLYTLTPLGSLGFTCVAMLYAVMISITLLHPNSILARAARTSVFVWLGHISYGVYLVHVLVLGLAHGFIADRPPSLLDAQGWMITAGSLAISLALAQLLHSFIEKPFIALGHRVRYMTAGR